MGVSSAPLLLLVVVLCGHAMLAAAVCTSPDCTHHELTSQARCIEVTRSRTDDCRWKAGLDTNVDYIIEGGDIIAYQIQWHSGPWSGWYVSGVNDIDWKYNTVSLPCDVPLIANHMRRVWSYFFDHTHRYIICNHRPDYTGTPAPCPELEVPDSNLKSGRRSPGVEQVEDDDGAREEMGVLGNV